MQAMTLLRRITSGEPCYPAGLTEEPPVAFESASHAVRFDVQVAADLYWRSEQDRQDYRQLGVLRMPYSDIWMEWEIPDGTLVGGEPIGQDELIGMRCGAYMVESAKDQLNLCMFAINPQSDAMFIWPTVLVIDLDEQGMLAGTSVRVKYQGVSETLVRQSAAMVDMFSLPAIMALGLINCKNVVHRETGSLKIARSGTEKRRGIPAKELRYNTIILPGGGTVSGTRSGSSHRAAAVHKVRGHFKTFTAEKPLLGRHVGTWWWGWSLRGDPQNGEVHSDYVLGERP